MARNIQIPTTGPVSGNDIPVQVATSYITESQSSREIEYDLQRKSMVQRFLIRGTPDVAMIDPQSLDVLRPGSPHGWFPMWDRNDSAAYATKVSVRHHSFGQQPVAGETGVASTLQDQGEAQAWSIMTVWYVQRPCPLSYEESYTVSLASFPEWYVFPFSPEEIAWRTENGLPVDANTLAPKPLTGSIQAIGVLRPVPIYRRRYVKVYLNPQEVGNIRREGGKLNGKTFLGESPGFWMLDGVSIRHLHGRIKEGDNAAFEVILVFRGDPYRRHRHVKFKPTSTGHRPMDFRGLPVPPGGWTYELMHDFRRLYPDSTRDWDGADDDTGNDLIPHTRSQDDEACLPNAIATS